VGVKPLETNTIETGVVGACAGGYAEQRGGVASCNQALQRTEWTDSCPSFALLRISIGALAAD